MKIESTFLLVSILAVLTVTSVAAAATAVAPTSIPFFSLSTHSVLPTVQLTSS